MGSIISYDLECPQCKEKKAFSDLYYKNHEEYFFCENEECGFGYSYVWKRDEDHKLVTQDGTENCKFDNLIMVETVFEDGKEKKTEIKKYIEFNKDKDNDNGKSPKDNV